MGVAAICMSGNRSAGGRPGVYECPVLGLLRSKARLRLGRGGHRRRWVPGRVTGVPSPVLPLPLDRD